MKYVAYTELYSKLKKLGASKEILQEVTKACRPKRVRVVPRDVLVYINEVEHIRCILSGNILPATTEHFEEVQRGGIVTYGGRRFDARSIEAKKTASAFYAKKARMIKKYARSVANGNQEDVPKLKEWKDKELVW